MLRRLLIPLCALAPLPALANDSTAELGTGGLILSRTDAISMDSEDLFISQDRVTVDYVFQNRTDKDVDTIVAFPMPDIEGNPYWMPAIPADTSDNFLDFEVSVDGKAVEPKLEQKAFAVGIDVTAELQAQGVPLYPFGKDATAALEKLPRDVADDWVERGIIVLSEYDDGGGMKTERAPYWELKSTYWWRSVFPANKPVKVSHRYKPSVGASSGLSFFSEGKIGGYDYPEYKIKYCMDEAFERAVLKAAKESPDGYPRLYETRISYVLTTGGNWATGTIGKFKLTIDKGAPEKLVSFCGEGVRKTGPTTFEMTADDYSPERDIDVLILGPFDWDDGEPTADDGPASKAAAGEAPAAPATSSPPATPSRPLTPAPAGSGG